MIIIFHLMNFIIKDFHVQPPSAQKGVQGVLGDFSHIGLLVGQVDSQCPSFPSIHRYFPPILSSCPGGPRLVGGLHLAQTMVFGNHVWKLIFCRPHKCPCRAVEYALRIGVTGGVGLNIAAHNWFVPSLPFKINDFYVWFLHIKGIGVHKGTNQPSNECKFR